MANFKKERCKWGKYHFIRVSQKKFDNFIRYFQGLKKIKGDFCMDWHDFFDESICPEEIKNSEERWDESIVARHYECPYGQEFWIRIDYIEKNNYDLDTKVPKPRKKRLTKKEKQFSKMLTNVFDKLFELEAKKQLEELEKKND